MKVGLVGWRGMVGSVLRERMAAEGDFAHFEAEFFTTSNVGGQAPDHGQAARVLADAYDLDALAAQDVVISCQGGDYTKKVYFELRHRGWTGYWIDAASALRMHEDGVIILDPVNRPLIDRALNDGLKTFVGGNCTVSLMLMGLGVLFQEGLVKWMSCMTYQAASGAGARHMTELVAQMTFLADKAGALVGNPAASALEVDRAVRDGLAHEDFPQARFGAPLAASAIPWVDRLVDGGQSREEWKGHVETNRILGLNPEVPVDGLCVRIGALRCHASAVTAQLTGDIPLSEINQLLEERHDWVRLIPNTPEATLKYLTPAAVSGSLTVPVGRVRKMRMGGDFLTAFTVGDQLLWGAAEPLRRMVGILQGRL